MCPRKRPSKALKLDTHTCMGLRFLIPLKECFANVIRFDIIFSCSNHVLLSIQNFLIRRERKERKGGRGKREGGMEMFIRKKSSRGQNL